jgi:hypothetical protein
MRNAGWLAVLGVVATLAGCGTVQAGRQAAPAIEVALAAHGTPQQRAAADAASMVAAFAPPPHAMRDGRSPVTLLAHAPTEPLSPDVVIRTAWWQVAGRPQTVLAWIQAHEPAGFSDVGGGGAGFVPAGSHGPPPVKPPYPSPPLEYADFALPDVPGVLADRELIAAVTADGQDRTVIGVYAEVMWVPTKPATERIPASARVVTITPISGALPAAAADHQVTITDPAQLARIAATVNALPMQPRVDWVECGPYSGPGMQLTFRATAAGPALAVVTAHQELCQLISVVIGGKTMPVLDGTETLFQRVMAIGGFHWNDFPAPGPTTAPAPTTPAPSAPGPTATASSGAS